MDARVVEVVNWNRVRVALEMGSRALFQHKHLISSRRSAGCEPTANLSASPALCHFWRLAQQPATCLERGLWCVSMGQFGWCTDLLMQIFYLPGQLIEELFGGIFYLAMLFIARLSSSCF